VPEGIADSLAAGSGLMWLELTWPEQDPDAFAA
jgi:hypothetical protein